MLTKQLFPKWKALVKADAALPVRLVFDFASWHFREKSNEIVSYIEQKTGKKSFTCSGNNLDRPFSRTICFGGKACEQVLGRKVGISSTRRGFCWSEFSGELSPVLWVFDPSYVEKNAIRKQRLGDDLAHCVSCDVPELDRAAVFHIPENRTDVEEAAAALSAAKWVAYDCETAGKMFSEYFEITALGATTDTGETYLFDSAVLVRDETLEPIKAWLVDPNALKVGHNLKYDMLSPLCAWGIMPRGFHSDTRLKRKLFDPEAISSLETCSELVGMGGYKQEFQESLDVVKKAIRKERTRHSKNQLSMFGDLEPKALAYAKEWKNERAETFAYALVPSDTLNLYCARDAYTTALLEKQVNADIVSENSLFHAWRNIVKDATPAITQIEAWGVKVDRAYMREFSEKVLAAQRAVAEKLQAAGLDDPNSQQKVAKFLYEDLKLAPLRESEKTGNPSTDAASLEALRGQSKEADLLLEYRRLAKLSAAYGESLERFIRADGRIHPEFRLDGTRTGRLSCREPGLHQIPRAQSEEGRMIKDCFVAEEGCSLLQLDYSQLELRVAAMLSEDPVMISMFKSGEDFHTATAKLVAPVMWGIKPEEVEKKHRTASKVFNFGLLYGMTINGLAERLHCEPDEAQRLKNSILGAWKNLNKWINAQYRLVERTGYTYTWWDGKKARRRALFNISSPDKFERHKAKNAAVNTPVQGTASDFCLKSIIKIVQEIERGEIVGKLVLTVHDSIILETPDDYIVDTARKVAAIMQGWNSKGVPLKVDCECGKRWGTLTAINV